MVQHAYTMVSDLCSPSNMSSLRADSRPVQCCCSFRYNFDVRKGPVKIEWFVGAETNLTYNALDRHVEAGHGDRVAFYWEGNDLNEQSVTTYKQLLDQASL